MKMLRVIIRERAKGGKQFSYQVLAHEMIAATKNEGLTIQAKQEVHRQCEANRAYAQFRVTRIKK
jgi:small subunit ribosomal protein S7